MMTSQRLQHYRGGIREEVRTLVQPELHDLQTRLQAQEESSRVQSEVMSLLIAFLLQHGNQIDGETLRSFLAVATSPYSELDIRHGHFLDAVAWIEQRLPPD